MEIRCKDPEKHNNCPECGACAKCNLHHDYYCSLKREPIKKNQK